MDINYRSSAYIVNGALRVIGNNKIRFEKKIEAFQKEDETVHVQEVKDPVQEAEYVLGKIKECQEKGIAYTDIGVVPDEYRCKGNVGTYDGISDSVRDERTSE